MQPQKPRSLSKLIAACEASARRCAEELALAEKKGARNKYVERRAIMAKGDARVLGQLRRLEAGGADPNADVAQSARGGGEGGGGGAPPAHEGEVLGAGGQEAACAVS